MTADPAHDRAVRRYVLVALIVPAVLVVVAVGIQLIALPHVPATVAIHWDASGEPNGFAPAWTQPLLTVLIGGGIPALLGLAPLRVMRRGDRGATYRLLGSTAAALAALTSVAFTWTFVGQVGLSDAADAPSIWAPLVASLVGALGVGVGAWFLQPAERWPAATPVPMEPLSLAPGEHAVWLRTTTMPTGAVIAVVGAAVLAILGAVLTWLTGAGPEVVWTLTVLALVLVVALAVGAAFHVRVDEGGLHVDSALGVPRFRVPLSDVASAALVPVSPMGDFGGWGVRWRPGRFGVVVRTGEAIEVTRRSGKRFVVTVDDAQTGAALLQALAARAGA